MNFTSTIRGEFMKYAFISDIHGNAVALEAVLHHLQHLNIDQIYVLGDICFRGPEPKRALELVRSLQAKVIKGNADEWIVRGVMAGEVPEQALEMMNKERDWSVSQLNETDIEYLKNLPEDLKIETNNGNLIHAFHATPADLFEIVQQNGPIAEKIMIMQEASMYVYAHIHNPFVTYRDGKCVANLGSIGLPFDGQPLASFLVVEEVGEQLRVYNERVPYDISKVINQLDASEYPNKELLKKVILQAKNPTDVT